MNYGYFDDPNREYVIINPRTPAKWINYVAKDTVNGNQVEGSLVRAEEGMSEVNVEVLMGA